MELYWLEQSAGDVPSGNEWLSKTELGVLNRLAVPKRHDEWRLGRWTAKCAVAARLGLPETPEMLAAIEVRPAPSGAPEAFINGRPAGLAISLSHSNGTGFCAVGSGGSELGCDVEQVETRSNAFAADYFTRQEEMLVLRTAPGDRDRLLTILWSAKESVLKATRSGLRADTRSVTAAPLSLTSRKLDAWHPLQAFHERWKPFHGWWRVTGRFVWTIVGQPAPQVPVALRDQADCRKEEKYAAACGGL